MIAACHRNTSAHAVVALGAALLAFIVQGCGGSSPSASTLVKETFSARHQINSGELALAVSLSGGGLGALRAPIALRASGPFQDRGPRQLPDFDLDVELKTASHTLQTGAISSQGSFFLKLAGIPFLAPAQTRVALQRSYAQQSAYAERRGLAFAALGVSPASWLTHPIRVGTQLVAGQSTIHLVAGLDLARFLADAGRLLADGAALGTAQAAGLLSPGERAALLASLLGDRVDLYVGERDRLLRRLSLHLSLASSPRASRALHGLRDATLNLQLTIAKVNEPQRILAPKNARPAAQLLAALRELNLAAARRANG